MRCIECKSECFFVDKYNSWHCKNNSCLKYALMQEGKRMKFWEALKAAVENNEKIRRLSWGYGKYYCFDNDMYNEEAPHLQRCYNENGDEVFNLDKMALNMADILNSDDWVIYDSSKYPKLLAPAVYQDYPKRSFKITDKLFSSLEEAKEYCKCDGYRLIWPAVPNKDGFYEVPEVE